MSRTGLTMNPRTSLVLLLVGRLVSIVTAGSPAPGESLLHVSYLSVTLPVYLSIYLSPFVCHFIYLYVYLSLSLYLSVCLSLYLSVYLS